MERRWKHDFLLVLCKTQLPTPFFYSFLPCKNSWLGRNDSYASSRNLWFFILHSLFAMKVCRWDWFIFWLFELLIIECMMNIHIWTKYKKNGTSSIGSAFMKEGKANNACKKWANIPQKTIFSEAVVFWSFSAIKRPR